MSSPLSAVETMVRIENVCETRVSSGKCSVLWCPSVRLSILVIGFDHCHALTNDELERMVEGLTARLDMKVIGTFEVKISGLFLVSL